MLQEFLDHGMLEIGEGDEKFAYLERAAQDIAQQLKTTRSIASPYTLVALDSTIPSDEPVLESVMMIIKHHWKTFRNTFRDDVPQQILRAVILEALQQACDEDDALVSIVWLTGRSYLPYMQQGSEYDLCTHFLHGLGERAESNATSMWSDADSLSSMETAVAPQFALPEIDVTALDKDELVQQVTAAASPGTNPYTVAQNASAWSAHFGQAVASTPWLK